MKQKFNIITSTCVPLPLENVDTDQIMASLAGSSNPLGKLGLKVQVPYWSQPS